MVCGSVCVTCSVNDIVLITIAVYGDDARLTMFRALPIDVLVALAVYEDDSNMTICYM